MTLCERHLLLVKDKFNASEKESVGLEFNQKTKNLLHKQMGVVN